MLRRMFRMANDSGPGCRAAALAAAALTAISFLLIRPVAAQGLAALITDVKGKVEIRTGGGWRPIALLASLSVGAQVRAAAGAHATLSFVRGGSRASVHGPCTVRILAGGVQVLSGSRHAVKTVTPPGRAALALASDVNIARMGGAQQRRLDRATLEITSDERVTDPRPVIAWRTAAVCQKYELRVSQHDSPHGEICHLTLPGSARRAVLPAGAKLAYGRQFDVNLTGYQEAVVHATQTVEVIPRAEAARLQADRREAERQFQASPGDVTPLVLLMARYEEAGLNAPALALAERISRLRPADRSFYRVLGRLYDRCHDPARADEMYRKAGGR